MSCSVTLPKLHIPALYLILVIVAFNLAASLFLILFRLQVFPRFSAVLEMKSSTSPSVESLTHAKQFHRIIRPLNSLEEKKISGEDEETTTVGDVGDHAANSMPPVVLSVEQKVGSATDSALTATTVSTQQHREWVSRGLFIDCESEANMESDTRCLDWQMAGYCDSHPPTRFLFCRRHCFCYLPPSAPASTTAAYR